MAVIGHEVLFDLDNFKKPKILSLKETVVQSLVNLFFMRPGNIPSMPHIGLNITQYLYMTEREFNPEEIKAQIYNQCSELISFIVLGELNIFVTKYKEQDVLIFSIPITGIEEEEVTLLLGFSNTGNGINVASQFEENK